MVKEKARVFEELSRQFRKLCIVFPQVGQLQQHNNGRTLETFERTSRTF